MTNTQNFTAIDAFAVSEHIWYVGLGLLRDVNSYVTIHVS